LRQGLSIFTHLTVRERVELYRLGRTAHVVLEIGSYLGASASCFAAAIKNGSGTGKVFCVDTWHNETMPDGIRDTFGEFTRNMASYDKFIVPVRGFSTQVISTVMAQTDRVDLLFIDGDHSYEAVKADWEAYKPLLKPHSIVVFHDWGWAEGVQRVIRENVTPIVERFDSLPNMWWGTTK
jgi:predicted O-methyltransferase YrrM